MSSFWKRTIFGTIYLLLLITCVLWNKYSFMALFTFFVGVLIHEFLKMTMGDEYKWSQIQCIAAGAIFFALVWAARAMPSIHPQFVFLAMLPVMGIMINSLYIKDKTDFGKFANIYTALFYISIPMSLSNFLVMDKYGEFNGLLLICFFIIIWMSDIGGYVFGLTFGKIFTKKLFPEISPKKSWAGFWGGLILSATASILMLTYGMYAKAGLNINWVHAAILAVLMHIFGVYGDLFESQWKRHYGIKDSGRIIPGHGGLLDRLDSALFAIPAGMLYLTICNLI